VLTSDAVRAYLNSLVVEGRSQCTVKGAKSALKQFAGFLADQELDQINRIDYAVLNRYREDIAWHFTAKGKPLAEPSGIVRACTGVLPVSGTRRMAVV
jgi:site-specific recombinase XerD